jgi:hypothetical protein
MVFDSFKGYGFVHHRALNNPTAFDKYIDIATRFPDRTHIMEGDVCWDFTDKREMLYFRHPSLIVDTLSATAVEKGLSERTLIGPSSLPTVASTGAFVVAELKVGRGDWRRALRALVELLETNLPGRYWIDGFSLPMLQYVKQFSPATPVTLHTECVCNGRVVIGAPEWPPLRIRRIDELENIDGIIIRRRGSSAFMAKACKDVRDSGKALLLSRLHSLQDFEHSKTWGAAAGYMHWDFEDLIRFNDKLDGLEAPAATVTSN